MVKLYQTYILPHLDYAIAVWNPSARKDKDILESVQRRFSRMVSGMKGLSYEERLTLLELPTLEERRRRIDLIQAYRIWYEVDQIDHPMFKPTSSSHGISTRQCSKSNVLAKNCRLNLRRNFFSQRVISDWNSLPASVQQAPSLGAFKSRVKRYLS